MYLLASGLNKSDEERKIAILLNLIGEDALEVYNTFEKTSKPRTYSEEIQLFETYCNPKKNILHVRFLFYNRKQREGESFDNFLTEITTLAQNCEFTNTEELIRDKMVLGTNDMETQERLIKMGELSLKDAIEHLRLAEIRKVQTKQIQSETEISVDAIQHKKGQYQQRRTYEKNKRWGKKDHKYKNHYDNQYNKMPVDSRRNCMKCGKSHTDAESCPAKGKQCLRRGKDNHFAQVCKTNLNKNNVRVLKINTGKHKASSESENEYFCDSITKKNKQINDITWVENVLVEDKVQKKFKLDSGSDVNIISLKTYNKIVRSVDEDIKLQNKSRNIEAYGGTNIEVIGITKLKNVLNNKNTMSHENFIVAKNDAVSILGLETCLKLKLINRTAVNELKKSNIKKIEVIHKYRDVFRGVGCFKNPYSIKLKENHTPLSKPPHRVPIKVK